MKSIVYVLLFVACWSLLLVHFDRHYYFLTGPLCGSSAVVLFDREGTTSNSRVNNEDQNAPIAANQHATNNDT